MTIAEQLTRAKQDLDAVYAAGKAAGSPKNRKEYSGTIDTEVVGTWSYATLLQDDLLAEIRTLDTLFVRVECDVEPQAYTIIKTWANNASAKVMPAYNGHTQVVHRFGSSGGSDISGNTETLYSTSVSGKVGLLNITEDGELRWYSGSNGNYYIRPCKFKVIVEW